MTRRLNVISAAALLLAACGGGDSSDPSQSNAAGNRRSAEAAGQVPAEAVAPEQAAEQLFAFAQTSIYSNYFPGNPSTQSYPPFRYRAYSNGVLLGVVVSANMGYVLGGVYVMGGPFGNQPLHVGPLTSFITPFDPASTAPTQSTLSSNGGTLAVQAADSPLRGLEVTVPAAALNGTADTISARVGSELPGPVQEELRALGAQPIGPTVVLSRSNAGSFGDAVLVRLPAPAQQIGSEDIMATVWDETSGRYVPLEIVGIDRAQGHVYALTRHFSSFNVFAVPSELPKSVHTSFEPGTHEFSHPNFSAWNVGGACYGTVAFAKWHWRNRPGVSLYTRFGGGDMSFFGDDVVRELMGALQVYTGPANSRISNAMKQQDDSWLDSMLAALNGAGLPIAARATKRELEVFHGGRLARQLASDGPQLLTIGAPANPRDPEDKGLAHALLVYAFERSGDGGTFIAYDPNYPYPSPPRRITWSSTDGFTPFPYLRYTANRFWVTATDTWFDSATLQALERAAEASALNYYKAAIIQNIKLVDGTRACITTSEQPNQCNIVVGSIDHAPEKDPTYISMWNRTMNLPLAGEKMPDGGRAPRVIPVQTSALTSKQVNQIEVIVDNAGPNRAAQIEATGNIYRYQAFDRAPVKPTQLQLEAKTALDGYEVRALLDGQDVLPLGQVQWRVDNVLQGEISPTLKLGSATPPIATISATVVEGGDKNPSASVALGVVYDATYTTRSVTIGSPIGEGCSGGACTAEMHCGYDRGAEVGAIERSVDSWALSVSGLATLTTQGDEGPFTVKGTYSPANGSIRIAQSFPPEPAPVRGYFTEGSIALNATLMRDGSIKGTVSDVSTTSWDRDDRTVSCNKVADFVAIPRSRAPQFIPLGKAGRPH